MSVLTMVASITSVLKSFERCPGARFHFLLGTFFGTSSTTVIMSYGHEHQCTTNKNDLAIMITIMMLITFLTTTTMIIQMGMCVSPACLLPGPASFHHGLTLTSGSTNRSPQIKEQYSILHRATTSTTVNSHSPNRPPFTDQKTSSAHFGYTGIKPNSWSPVQLCRLCMVGSVSQVDTCGEIDPCPQCSCVLGEPNSPIATAACPPSAREQYKVLLHGGQGSISLEYQNWTSTHLFYTLVTGMALPTLIIPHNSMC